MRSNDGKGESRNNVHDPTLRDRDLERATIKSQKEAKAAADHRQGQQKSGEARQRGR